MWERVGYRYQEAYEGLCDWLARYLQGPPEPLDVFFSRLFGDLLTRPGYALHANPLGARALYLYRNGKDTLYRLHGSPEWASIGKSVSSGCVRLINQDVIDLYDRVAEKSPIVVTSGLRVT